MKLIVGLGNPGARYERTRHNLGFRVVDEVAGRLSVACDKSECHAKTAHVRWRGHSLLLAKPQTYMNRSGEAVSALVCYYKIEPSNIMIVYDDLALPPGRLRVRAKGSAGGHNGVRSIINYLRTDGFPRIRIGIGSVPEGWAGADYVLAPFSKEEEPLIEEAIQRAADATLYWVEAGIDAVMREFNRTREPQA